MTTETTRLEVSRLGDVVQSILQRVKYAAILVSHARGRMGGRGWGGGGGV